jgi:hypothetical protein
MEDIAFANAVYTNQQLQRTSFPAFFDEGLGRLNANWPCFFGMSVIGRNSVYGEGAAQYKDGWKWVCGMRILAAQRSCVIYSMGSAGMMDFERVMLERLQHCEVHIFDRGDDFSVDRALTDFFPDSNVRTRVHFHDMFIGAADDFETTPMIRSLPSIAKELGHDHIDVLKCDVEGSEFEIFDTFGELAQSLSIGQLLLEVHLCLGYQCRNEAKRKTKKQLYALVEEIESAGLRLFHKEMNARYSPFAAELAFVQKDLHYNGRYARGGEELMWWRCEAIRAKMVVPPKRITATDFAVWKKECDVYSNRASFPV